MPDESHWKSKPAACSKSSRAGRSGTGEARQTLSSEATGTGLEGSIYAGLESLTSKLLDREWQRDDGAAMRIGRCLIDANWGQSTDVIYQFCRQSKHAAVIIPSHGRFVGASSLPFSEYRRRPGDRVGLNWRIPNVHGKRAIRHMVYDTNHWFDCLVGSAVAASMQGCVLLGTDVNKSVKTDRLSFRDLQRKKRV